MVYGYLSKNSLARIPYQLILDRKTSSDRITPLEVDVDILKRKTSGNSSVGRAQPCQGWGREFESRFPLQTQDYATLRRIINRPRRESFGWVAEWLCSGLQSRGRRFDSDPSL
jgi:hypothetical protein